jgi:cysteine desulfurase
MPPIEHASIQATAQSLKSTGSTLRRLNLSSSGVVLPGQLSELLESHSAEVGVVAVMLANNEVGAIQPVEQCAEMCGRYKVPLHVDAAQAAGKLPISFRSLGAATMAIAAHKFNGPLGIGALIVRGAVQLEPVLFGGFQQEGVRPGTESVALAVGMQTALEIWERERTIRAARLRDLRDQFEGRLLAAFPGRVVVNAGSAPRLPNTSNIAFLGLDRQALLMALDLAGVACSTGSACASGSSEPSAVLKAMGCGEDVLRGSLRFSFGAFTTQEEIDEAVDRILSICRSQWAGQASGSSAKN